MHNLAIVLKKKGSQITGSDDEIYEPSKSRLKNYGLHPNRMGWNPDRLTEEIDLVILGMHAKSDNPELKKAQDLGIRIMSYPEFVYEQSKDKIRIVVGGSHGKTTTTSLIMCCLKYCGFDFDYLIGAKVEGFEDMLSLTDAPMIVIEGDEYLSSAIDRRPKFLHYNPNIAVLTGIEWDHINVFPSFEDYKHQFHLFIKKLRQGSTLIYFESDPILNAMISETPEGVKTISYKALKRNSKHKIVLGKEEYNTTLFGAHNDQNLHAAMLVCKELGISESDFFRAIESYKGASRRLERISKVPVCYFDFAHAPSKVRATVEAVRGKHPRRKIVALLELHTFSSLNASFLPNYKDTLKAVDKAIVFCNRKTFEHKGMKILDKNHIRRSFNSPGMDIYFEKKEIENIIHELSSDKTPVILIMSSGNFGGVPIKQIFTNGI